jgi:hypothetical protein
MIDSSPNRTFPPTFGSSDAAFVSDGMVVRMAAVEEVQTVSRKARLLDDEGEKAWVLVARRALTMRTVEANLTILDIQ